MDIGSLDIGDYLGTASVIPFYFYELCSLFGPHYIHLFFQQLVQYLLQRILYAHCRYGRCCNCSRFFKQLKALTLKNLTPLM